MRNDSSGQGPRLGVEEEFWVVDPATREIVPYAWKVLGRAEKSLGERASGEITEVQAEVRTTPCATVADLRDQLLHGRRALAAAAADEDLRIMASGTPVLGPMIPSPITDGPRQDRGNATFRGLHHELSICAMHVHVELPEREQAVMVGNHLRPYLPMLIALMANSPYWAERDTGYASWRTLLWSRWPVAGPPPYFSSASHYDELVSTLLEAGALVDSGTIFWDIRPSSHLPTLEIRVADVPITAEESVLLAALVRALVVTVLPAVDAGDPGPQIPTEMLRLAYWRAARDGLAGHGIDLRSGKLVPMAQLAQGLLETARPGLAEVGEEEQVAACLERLLCEGDGATRQRRVAARRGRLTDVVDHLIDQAGRDHQQSMPE